MRHVIYIGPSVLSLGLQRFQVFKEPPKVVVAEPKLARLCVPVNTLAKARAALSVEGSPEWSAYRAAAAAFLPNQAR